MKVAAVITAGGSGSRFKSKQPKQFLKIGEKTILERSVDVFESSSLISTICIVLPKEYVNEFSTQWWKENSYTKVNSVVAGGETRQASVYEGLKSIGEKTTMVAIHDGARCLLSLDVLEKTVRSCSDFDGAIAATQVSDSIKKTEGNLILKSLSRENMWAMQTPQVFKLPFIYQAYQKADEDNFSATDDAQVAEHFGGRVCVVESETSNLKITHPKDIELAKAFLKGSL